uniref:Reverse transcriptase/retrotransposon-derived protein RNase H-like domain-containing protein n=1 Tax=Amazona collaria TaxID=241587 RepID=A0A8B9F6D8_9PSIT
MELQNSYEATRNEEVEPIAWGLGRKQASKATKGALPSAPALSPPDYTKAFSIYVHERKGIDSGVITQKSGLLQRPVAYYSVQLDLVTTGAPACIKSVAAVVTMLEKMKDMT